MPFTVQIASSASQDRLEKLIRAHLEPGADKALTDRKIWDLFGERWCVMFTALTLPSASAAFKLGYTL